MSVIAPVPDLDIQDAIDDAREVIGELLRDIVNTFRAQPATVPATPLGTIPPPGASGGNGRGGLTGSTATGGNTDNRGGVVPNYQPNLTNVPCRLESVMLRTGPVIVGGRITERAQWQLRVPYGTDIQSTDLIDYYDFTNEADPQAQRFQVKDLMNRTDQLTFMFFVEKMS